MAKKTLTNADAFDEVLAFFVKENGGRKFGAKTLMAKALGVTRQSIDNMDGVGIRRKYLPKLQEITGMSPEQLLPEPYKPYGK
jgi:hypothetical protein